jgi:TonB-linked SusC/RagA family outer membrane protein
MKNILKYISLLFLGAAAVSCDFEDMPFDKYDSDFVFSNDKKAEGYVLGVYLGLPFDKSDENGYNRVDGAMLASASDEAMITVPGSSIVFLTDGSLTPRKSNPDGCWENNYKFIRDANIGIVGLEKLPEANHDLKLQLQAELKFLKAFFYFELVKRYGGVPLIDRAYELSDDLNVPRSSFAACVDYIAGLCDESYTDLPAPNNVNFGRASKGAALALKARLLLYAASPLYNGKGYDGSDNEFICYGSYDKKRWESAAAAAAEVIRLGDSPYTHPDNDYVKDFLRKTTPMHKLNVNVRGGTDNVRYYVALSGLSQEGIYRQFDGKYPSNANFKRINLRANLDFSLTKTTELSLDLNGRLDQKQNNSQGLNDNSIFSMMYETPPMSYPYRLPDGSYGASTDNEAENLMAMLSDWGYSRLASNILEGTVKLHQKLDFVTKGLSVRGMVSFNSYYDDGTKVSYRPPTYRYVSDTEKVIAKEETAPSISSLSGKGHRRRTNIEVGINYNRTFGDHAVTAMAVYTQTKENTNAVLPRAFLGYAARATYAYKSKYLAEVNLGYNGSDQFDEGHRYDFFPSFALGYVLSNEGFMQRSLPFITFMKLRASYGEVGNDKIGSDRFLYLQTYDKNGNYFFGKDNGFGGMPALSEGALGNTNVTWEIGKKTNIGIDLTFFDKLTLNADIFREDREKIFISRNTTPQILGVGTAKENLGKVRNEGFEIEAGYRDVVNRNFSWFVSGMFSYSKNKVLYKDEVEPKYEYLRQTGKPIGQYFGHTVLRYYLPDDFTTIDGVRVLNPDLPQPQYPVQPGDFMYWDRNDDGVIDTFDEGPIGRSKIPRFVYNFTFGLNFRNFDFSMMWQGAGGNSKLMTKSLYEPVRERNRFQDIHLYRWTEERWQNGETIKYPRLSSATNKHNQCTNTFYLKKGDYLRLKSIEIGYTFNKRQLRFIGLNSIRIYVGGNNLLTFSEIKNFDPEMGDETGYFYPQMKMWNFGININF